MSIEELHKHERTAWENFKILDDKTRDARTVWCELKNQLELETFRQENEARIRTEVLQEQAMASKEAK